MRVARATSNARRSDGRNIEWSHNANSDPGRLRPFADTPAQAPKPNPAGYNPFNDPAAAPKLIPVDYDPFADVPGVPARFVPVDHDPFADAPAAAPKLIPVDYDPFADAPGVPARLVPVDHDPFADAPAAAPKLIPVDYDPFADAPGVPARLVPVDYDPFAAPASNAGGSPALSNPTTPHSRFRHARSLRHAILRSACSGKSGHRPYATPLFERARRNGPWSANAAKQSTRPQQLAVRLLAENTSNLSRFALAIWRAVTRPAAVHAAWRADGSISVCRGERRIRS
jgi:hypothetical protein